MSDSKEKDWEDGEEDEEYSDDDNDVEGGGGGGFTRSLVLQQNKKKKRSGGFQSMGKYKYTVSSLICEISLSIVFFKYRLWKRT